MSEVTDELVATYKRAFQEYFDGAVSGDALADTIVSIEATRLGINAVLAALSHYPVEHTPAEDARELLMVIENAARMAEQGVLSADGGQAAVEIRSLVPLRFRNAMEDYADA